MNYSIDWDGPGERDDGELVCSCGVGHGSLDGHIDWCAWSVSKMERGDDLTAAQLNTLRGSRAPTPIEIGFGTTPASNLHAEVMCCALCGKPPAHHGDGMTECETQSCAMWGLAIWWRQWNRLQEGILARVKEASPPAG